MKGLSATDPKLMSSKMASNICPWMNVTLLCDFECRWSAATCFVSMVAPTSTCLHNGSARCQKSRSDGLLVPFTRSVDHRALTKDFIYALKLSFNVDNIIEGIRA
jgi:hypothetical protein